MNKLIKLFTKVTLALCLTVSAAHAHHSRMYVNYLVNGDINIVSGTYHSATQVAGTGYGYNINGVHFAPDFDRTISNTDYLTAWNSADNNYIIPGYDTSTIIREMGLTLTLTDLIGFGVNPGDTLSFNINDSSVVWQDNGNNFQLVYNPTTSVTTANPTAAVPAPSALLLIALGLFGLGYASRHKVSSKENQILA